MSGYWQAVERSLGSESDAALPRPRSRFEEPLAEFAEEAPASRESVDEVGVEQSPTATPAARPIGQDNPAPRAVAVSPAAASAVQAFTTTTPQEESVRPDLPASATTPPAPEPVPARVPTPDQAQHTVPPPEWPTAAASATSELMPSTPPPPLPLHAEQFAPSPPAGPDNPVSAPPVPESPGVVAVPVVATALPMSAPADEQIESAADAVPPVPSLTVEIAEIQIRLAADGIETRTVVPLRAAAAGATASLQDFLVRQSDTRR